MQPSDIILLFVRSSTNRFLLFSKDVANSLAPSSMIKQSLKWRLVKVSLAAIPFAKAFAPSTPIMLPSRSSLVKNFLFCRHSANGGMQLSLMPIFYKVMTLSVSFSIRPWDMALSPSSCSGLLFKLILLNLYLLERISPISFAPFSVIWLFSR